MKLVGADSGHYEQEELVDEVLLAPSSGRSSTSSSTTPESERSSTERPRSPTGLLRSRSSTSRPSPT